MKIDLTEQEANELIKVLDDSIAYSKLAGARRALYFFDKIQSAFQVKKSETDNKQEVLNDRNEEGPQER